MGEKYFIDQGSQGHYVTLKKVDKLGDQEP